MEESHRRVLHCTWHPTLWCRTKNTFQKVQGIGGRNPATDARGGPVLASTPWDCRLGDGKNGLAQPHPGPSSGNIHSISTVSESSLLPVLDTGLTSPIHG